MPNIYKESLMALIRHIMSLVSGFFVSRVLLASNETGQLVELGVGLAGFILTIGLSLYQKHSAKKQLVVALAEAEMTEKEVVEHIASDKPMPTVLSSPTVVPVVPVMK